MPGYQTKQEIIAVAGVADLVIRSLLDRQQFADPLGDAERLGISSATWPLFGRLWPVGGGPPDRLSGAPAYKGRLLVYRRGFCPATAADTALAGASRQFQA